MVASPDSPWFPCQSPLPSLIPSSPRLYHRSIATTLYIYHQSLTSTPLHTSFTTSTPAPVPHFVSLISSSPPLAHQSLTTTPSPVSHYDSLTIKSPTLSLWWSFPHQLLTSTPSLVLHHDFLASFSSWLPQLFLTSTRSPLFSHFDPLSSSIFRLSAGLESLTNLSSLFPHRSLSSTYSQVPQFDSPPVSHMD